MKKIFTTLICSLSLFKSILCAGATISEEQELKLFRTLEAISQMGGVPKTSAGLCNLLHHNRKKNRQGPPQSTAEDSFSQITEEHIKRYRAALNASADSKENLEMEFLKLRYSPLDIIKTRIVLVPIQLFCDLSTVETYLRERRVDNHNRKVEYERSYGRPAPKYDDSLLDPMRWIDGRLMPMTAEGEKHLQIILNYDEEGKLKKSDPYITTTIDVYDVTGDSSLGFGTATVRSLDVRLRLTPQRLLFNGTICSVADYLSFHTSTAKIRSW